MRKYPAWSMALVSLAALALVLVTGCDKPVEAPNTSVETSVGPSVKQRWDAMTDEQRELTCAAVAGPLPGEGEVGGAESDGVDYRKVLWELEAAGHSQNEAAAMIPHVLEQCR